MSTTRLVIAGVFLLVALFLIIGTSPQPPISGPVPVQHVVGWTTAGVGTDASGYTFNFCTNSNGQILCANFRAAVDTNPSGLMKWRIIQALGPMTFKLTRVDTAGPVFELIRK